MSKPITRKRANKKTQPKIVKKNRQAVPVPKTADREGAVPLYQNETIVFNELVELSNQYNKLKTQWEQYEFIRVNLIGRRDKIQKGIIKLPIQIQLTQDMYYAEDDKKKILGLFDDQIKSITNSVKSVKQQVNVRRDMYIESGLRLLTFAEGRYGQYKMEEFRPRGATVTEAEKKLTEKEYDVLFKADAKDMQNPDVKAAFDTASKLAGIKNEKQKA